MAVVIVDQVLHPDLNMYGVDITVSFQPKSDIMPNIKGAGKIYWNHIKVGCLLV